MSPCVERARGGAWAPLALALILLVAPLPSCNPQLQLPPNVVTATVVARVFVMQDWEPGAQVSLATVGVPDTLDPANTLPSGLQAENVRYTRERRDVPHTTQPQLIEMDASPPLHPGTWDITIRLTTTVGMPSEVTCQDVRIDTLVGGAVPPVEVEWVEGRANCTSPASTNLRERGEHDVGPASIELPAAASTGMAADVHVGVVNAGRQDETNVVVNLRVQGPTGVSFPLAPVTLPTLTADGQPAPATFRWTPGMAGAHILTADVPPVVGETGTDSDGPFDNVVAGGDGLTNQRTQIVTVVADLDGDRVPDANDNCPLHVNPGQEDVDGDGHGDVCDRCRTVVSPGNADADMDGIGEACEFRVRAFSPPSVTAGAQCVPNCTSLGAAANCVAILGERLVSTQIQVQFGGQAATNIAGCDASGHMVYVGVPATAAAGQPVTVTHLTDGTTTAPKAYGYATPSCAPTSPVIEAVWPRSAIVGSRVGVVGCGFAAAASVLLEAASGGAPVAATAVTRLLNGDVLVFTVPPGVKSGRIRITNPGVPAVISSMVLEIN